MVARPPADHALGEDANFVPVVRGDEGGFWSSVFRGYFGEQGIVGLDAENRTRVLHAVAVADTGLRPHQAVVEVLHPLGVCR